ELSHQLLSSVSVERVQKEMKEAGLQKYKVRQMGRRKVLIKPLGDTISKAERHKGRYNDDKDMIDEVLEATSLLFESTSVVLETDNEDMNIGKEIAAILPQEPNHGASIPNCGINAPTSKVQEEPKRNDKKESEIFKDSRRIRRRTCRWNSSEKLKVLVDEDEIQRIEADTLSANTRVGPNRWATNTEETDHSIGT
ncbi:hypothetical protein Ancab_031515, partial [Ancistrocladus abbreviatus]